MMTIAVKALPEIRRWYVRKHRECIFLFGDNLLHKGLGGQAASMRGEPNAIGIPTKKKPDMTEDSFFTDDEFEENKKEIDKAFSRIPKDATVIIPMAGLGTGRAQLKERAPQTYTYICDKIHELRGDKK